MGREYIHIFVFSLIFEILHPRGFRLPYIYYLLGMRFNVICYASSIYINITILKKISVCI